MTGQGNPFEAPRQSAITSGADPTRLEKRRWRWHFVWWTVYLYPLLQMLSFYLVWLIAWAELGHQPRPSLDDPKGIGGLTSVIYYLPGLLLMGIPLLVPLGLLSPWLHPFASKLSRSAWRRLVLSFIYLAVCTISFLVLRYDWYDVVEWWFD